jgi:hypothetical protein
MRGVLYTEYYRRQAESGVAYFKVFRAIDALVI